MLAQVRSHPTLRVCIHSTRAYHVARRGESSQLATALPISVATSAFACFAPKMSQNTWGQPTTSHLRGGCDVRHPEMGKFLDLCRYRTAAMGEESTIAGAHSRRLPCPRWPKRSPPNWLKLPRRSRRRLSDFFGGGAGRGAPKIRVRGSHRLAARSRAHVPSPGRREGRGRALRAGGKEGGCARSESHSPAVLGSSQNLPENSTLGSFEEC
jgi:hypothetical protein